MIFREPYRKINDYSIELDKHIKSMLNSIKINHDRIKLEYSKRIAKLDALSPLKTLSRGYCITELNGKIVKSKNELKKEEKVKLKFYDGEQQAKII